MQVVTNLCSRRDHQGDGMCFYGNYQLLHYEAFSSSSQCNCYPIHWYGLAPGNVQKIVRCVYYTSITRRAGLKHAVMCLERDENGVNIFH